MCLIQNTRSKEKRWGSSVVIDDTAIGDTKSCKLKFCQKNQFLNEDSSLVSIGKSSIAKIGA